MTTLLLLHRVEGGTSIFFAPYMLLWKYEHNSSGLVLRLRQWRFMKQIMEVINKYAALGTALPCYLQDDHLNQLEALQCRECYPFSTDTY